MDLLVYIITKCGQGGRGSKIPKKLWTSFMYGPHGGRPAGEATIADKAKCAPRRLAAAQGLCRSNP